MIVGYTTEFAGHIRLSRKLTLIEARDWLAMAAGGESESKIVKGGYLQWVPSEDLSALVWDGNEKFYSYIEWLEWICGTWLVALGINTNGEMTWRGESSDDVGRIIVTNGRVVATKLTAKDPSPLRPLTERKLSQMVLAGLK